MHVIRLRDPWTVAAERSASDAAANLIVYSRKFHRPTDAEGQAIRLRIVFLPTTDRLVSSSLAVLVNEVEVPRSQIKLPGDVGAAEESYFELVDLAPFNKLELQIEHNNLDVAIAPRFGTFIIQSVELQIQERK